MIDLNHHVDGLVLHVEIGILKQFGDGGDIYIAAARGEGAQRRAANHLVGVAQLDLQRRVDIRAVEFLEQIDQVNLYHGIAATHARDEVRNHLRPDHALDDPEDGRLLLDVEVVGALQQLVHAQVLLVDLQHLDQCGLRHLVVLEPVEELVDVVIGGTAQRPRGAFYNTLVAVSQTLPVIVERLVVYERGQDIHKHHRV